MILDGDGAVTMQFGQAWVESDELGKHARVMRHVAGKQHDW